MLDPHNTTSAFAGSERFDVYAPLLPGRRHSYDLEMPDEATKGYFDSAADTMDHDNGMTAWLKQDDPDFVDDEKARDESARYLDPPTPPLDSPTLLTLSSAPHSSPTPKTCNAPIFLLFALRAVHHISRRRGEGA